MASDRAFLLLPKKMTPKVVAEEAAIVGTKWRVDELMLVYGWDVPVAGSAGARVAYAEFWATDAARTHFPVDSVAIRLSQRFEMRVLAVDYFEHADPCLGSYALFEDGEVIRKREHPPSGSWYGEVVRDGISAYVKRPVVEDGEDAFNCGLFPSGSDELTTWQILHHGNKRIRIHQGAPSRPRARGVLFPRGHPSRCRRPRTRDRLEEADREKAAEGFHALNQARAPSTRTTARRE